MNNAILTVNELFSGIGSQRKALERIGSPHKLVGISDIDTYAIKSDEEIFGKTRNYGDISAVKRLDYADFWTYSSPCQDFSASGRMQGIFDSNGKQTRSGLLLEVRRLLNVAKEHDELPKYLMLENVKNLVCKKFKPDFNRWLSFLDELGYNSYWEVLNAKNYGIPQNRERVFVISIRKDIDSGCFKFPEGFDSGLRLKDVLEENVDEKYYLRQELQEKFKLQITNAAFSKTVRTGGRGSTDRHSWDLVPDSTLQQVGTLKGCGLPYDKMHDQSGRIYDPEGIAPTVHTCGGGNLEPKILQRPRGYNSGGVHKISPTITANFWQGSNFVVASRGRYTQNGEVKQQFEVNNTGNTNAVTTVQKDNYVCEPQHTVYDDMNGRIKSDQSCVNTVMTQNCPHYNSKIIEPDGFRIRKLTPRETWRLMGFDDSDFDKAQAVNSNTQLYRQAGNSIVVDVLCHIFKNAFGDCLQLLPNERDETLPNFTNPPIIASLLAV
jgi:DNA (cytosine-5)-methyltransferase 1